MIDAISAVILFMGMFIPIMYFTKDSRNRPTTEELVLIRDRLIVTQQHAKNDPQLLLQLIMLEEKIIDSLKSRGYYV